MTNYSSEYEIGQVVNFLPRLQQCKELDIADNVVPEGVLAAIRFTGTVVTYDVFCADYGIVFTDVQSGKINKKEPQGDDPGSLQLPDFREMRKRRGMSTRKAGELAGVSNSYISQLESGKVQNPSFAIVQKLTKIYQG